MKKTENLILRIDPELKQLIDERSNQLGVSTSKLVRDILSTIFLREYENEKLKKEILEKLRINQTNLESIIDQTSIRLDNSTMKEIHNQSISNLDGCIELINQVQ